MLHRLYAAVVGRDLQTIPVDNEGGSRFAARACLLGAAGRDSRLRSVGNDEREQTLNQLLTELDGFESEKDAGPVICIAATNRPDVSCPCLYTRTPPNDDPESVKSATLSRHPASS